jgi:hypothetical protein
MRRTSMAKHLPLPAELWGMIFAHMDAKDRRSAAATCRHLRIWRSLAWAEILLPMHGVELLVDRMKQLAIILTSDTSLQHLVRSLSLCAANTYDISGRNLADRRAHGELNVTLAHVLRLVPNLESFVFTVRSKRWHRYALTVEAVCELSALKILVLSKVSALPEYSSETVLKCTLKSRVLRRFTTNGSLGMDMGVYLGEQKLLKEVTLEIGPLLSLDVATSWEALEKLSMGLATHQTSPKESDLYSIIISNGLVSMHHASIEHCAGLTSSSTGQWSTSPAEDAVGQRTPLSAASIKATFRAFHSESFAH